MRLRRIIGKVLVLLGGVALTVGGAFWLHYPWMDGGALVVFGLLIGVPLVAVGAFLVRGARST